jgi:hypothetical protein
VEILKKEFMYCIYLKENGEKCIHIEGKLNSVDRLIELLAEASQQKENPVVLDLSKTDSISEECMKKLKVIKTVYNIKFRNYSLYLEMQLNLHNLLPVNPLAAER